MSEERTTTAGPAEVSDGAAGRVGQAPEQAPEQTAEQTPEQTPDRLAGPEARPATFRAVPTVSLVAIGFLALCLSPIAFQGGAWFLLFLIPLAVAVWVVRTRTRVDVEGLHVRQVVGTRSVAWSEVTTLRLEERGWVHAVPREGPDLVLRGVRIRDLGRVGEASGGRISAPSPADAEAAAEHARELEAARMRVARLRVQQEATGEGDEDSDGAGTARTEAERADGGGVGGLEPDTTSAADDDDDDEPTPNADDGPARAIDAPDDGSADTARPGTDRP